MKKISLNEIYPNGSVYVFETNHDEHVSAHSHDCFEIVYVKNGFCTHTYNGASTVLVAGDLFNIGLESLHEYNRPHGTTIYNCLISIEKIDAILNEYSDLYALSEIFYPKDNFLRRTHFNATQRAKIEAIFDAIIKEQNENRHGSKLMIDAYIKTLLVHFARRFVPDELNKSSKNIYVAQKYLYKALDYIEENYQENIRIEKMAALSDISCDYFSKIFKIYIGLSPTEYIRNLRLSKASLLLSNTDYSISEIASKVGFDDPAYFTRQFTKMVGYSPSIYKKKNIKIY